MTISLQSESIKEEKIHSVTFWGGQPPLWDSDQHEELTCVQIRDETHDVKTFVFSLPEAVSFRFQPGQFLTLELEIEGESINRCYTISSAPTRPHTLSITVKRVPNGPVSNWLHDHLKVGGKVRALRAAGEFTCATVPAKKYLFLSAGSGITPLMSMSRTFHDLSDDRDIYFVHSARTPDDIIFEKELALIAKNQPHFKLGFVCERTGQRKDWYAPTGYLSLELLSTMVPDYKERTVFVCGPAPYMQSVRAILESSGYNMAQYHEESFSFESLASTSAAPSDAPVASNANGFKIHFQKTQREITCQDNQFILDAAREAGVRMPSSCTQGMCGTCKVKLISGNVDMKHQGGIRQREVDQGMILLCCSKPLSDIVIDK